MGLYQIYIITNYVRYTTPYNDWDHTMHGRYKPFKDLFHYECWRTSGVRDLDLTNSNNWTRFYYPRRHQNIPEDENMYFFYFLYYGTSTETLWDYT